MLDIVQIPVLIDNYIYLLHEPTTGTTAVVDPAIEGPVAQALEERGWSLDIILNTHHHGDHTGANMALKDRYNAKIIGPHGEASSIPGIDQAVGDGETVQIGDENAVVYDVPGHTKGHIAYYFSNSEALFCGDTLFAMGCGRLFEGTPKQMWQSLNKLQSLPDATRVYCAHEYTEANGNFALSVEPGNTALQERMGHVRQLRAHGTPTIPSTIALEKATNPFLRSDSRALQETLNLIGQDPVTVFAATRHAKDNF